MLRFTGTGILALVDYIRAVTELRAEHL